jgi:hypothetical protein
LQDVGNAEGRVEGVRGVGGPEVVREDAIPDQPRDPAQQDAGGDDRRRSRGARWAGAQEPEGGGREDRCGESNSRWRNTFSSCSV